MLKDKILDRANELFDDIKSIYDAANFPDDFIATRAAIISFLIKLYPDNHPYLKEIYSLEYPSEVGSNIIKKILKNIIKEIEQGFFNDLKFSISAEIFTDFIDMAEHLLDTGYKDAAAVILGSSLESHLREIAPKYTVKTTYKNKNGKLENYPAGKLNDELHKAGAYNASMHKLIIAWLQIRNDAAHGNYQNYSEKQARLMLDGVRSIISAIR